MRREEEEKWRMEVELLVEEEGEAGENDFRTVQSTHK
jgi:hypothetical protein